MTLGVVAEKEEKRNQQSKREGRVSDLDSSEVNVPVGEKEPWLGPPGVSALCSFLAFSLQVLDALHRTVIFPRSVRSS